MRNCEGTARRANARRICIGLMAGAAALWAGPVAAVSFSYSGYIREHLSVNLQDAPESVVPVRDGEFAGLNSRVGPENFEEIGGQGELSMARTTLKLDGLLDLGFAQVVGVARGVREHHTAYERRLQRAAKANPLWVYDGRLSNGTAALLHVPDGHTGSGTLDAFRNAGELVRDDCNGDPTACLIGLATAEPRDDLESRPGSNMTQIAGSDFGLHGDGFFDEYDSEALREIYAQFDVGSNNHFRIGRQQVVWGETDFFRAMDIIHGYDLRWRLFLELENEELRKPLIMFNYSRDIPQIDGALQLIYRPGWDKGSDIGDSLPLSGGRWGPQPLRGFDALSLSPYEYHHCSGDEDDPNYGGRLAGVTKQVAWSLNYYRGMSQLPVISRNPRVGGSPGIGCFEGPIGDGNRLLGPEHTGSDQTSLGQPGETVFPMVDTFGITANIYAGGWIDSVLKTEIAFTPNQPYNAGKNTWVDLGAFVLGYDDGDNDGSDDIPASNSTPPLPGSNADTFGGDNQVLYDESRGDDHRDCIVCTYFPGLREIKEKPTLKIMLGADKQMYGTTRWFLPKTQRPSFYLFQLFDQWVLNYDEDDELLELPAYGAPRREHTVYMTNALLMNYDFDTVNPGIAHAVDLGNFDQFLLPFLDLIYGDHWRVHMEASFFFAKHSNDRLTNPFDRDTRLLGSLVNHDQATVRVTYQF